MSSRKRKTSDDEKEQLKKSRTTAINATAQEFVCPLSLELPLDPVVAADGKVYERSVIEKHIQRSGRNLLTSPVTREPMRAELIPALFARNAIQGLVDSGEIEGDLAEIWKKSMANKNKVEETTKKAEGGDASTMYNLGRWYRDGLNGLPKNDKEAYKWYKKAADLNDVCGMAMVGHFLTYGIGVAKNVSEGIALTVTAAQLGSDFACDDMGEAYHKGLFGFPQNDELAKFWYKKVADESCKFKHFSGNDIANAKKLLRDLESSNNA